MHDLPRLCALVSSQSIATDELYITRRLVVKYMEYYGISVYIFTKGGVGGPINSIRWVSHGFPTV